MSDNNIDALSIRGLPAKISNNTRGPVRADQYGNLGVTPIGGMRHALADQGTYFIAHNITNDASTTLAGHPAPVLVDADATMTKPLVFMRNPTAPSANIRCYLDFIEIEVVTAGATGSSSNWAAQLDTGATRYSSGTVETLTTVNPNMQSTATPVLVTLAGPVVVGAESVNARNLGFGQIRAAIEFTGDRTTFRFGGQPSVGSNVVIGAASRHLVTLPPVVLGATDQFLLALYAPSQNAAGVYKVRCGWWALANPFEKETIMSDKNIDGLSSRVLPSKIANNTRGPVRTDQFGNLMVTPFGQARQTLSDQGAYFVAHNATNDASTTLANLSTVKLANCDATMTKPFFHVRMDPNASVRAYLDFIEIEVVTAAANGVNANWSAQLDTGATRITSAGTAFTLVNPNMQSTATPALAVQGGAMTSGAESANVRQLGFGLLRQAIEFAGDRTVWKFGDEPDSGHNVTAGAAARHHVNMPPVILGPSDQLLLCIYDATDTQDTAGVYKVRCGWWEV